VLASTCRVAVVSPSAYLASAAVPRFLHPGFEPLDLECSRDNISGSATFFPLDLNAAVGPPSLRFGTVLDCTPEGSKSAHAILLYLLSMLVNPESGID
jgi:hypothetical protein